MMTPRICSLAAATGLAGVAAFQVSLAFGAPLGRAAWGGRHAELSAGLRTGSAISALLLVAAATLVLGRAGFLRGPAGLFRSGTWVVAVLLTVSALGNLASSSPWEEFVQGPVALVIGALCFVVARGRQGDEIAGPNLR
jgi:hypothetical protein